jgi:translation initiation factor 1
MAMGLVYSTETGRVRTCQHCGRPLADGGRCACRVHAARAPGDGILRVRRETSGRKGKTVTTVSGAAPAQAAELARELKRLCGSGGSVVDGVIEIQGDHRERVVANLQARGLQVKSAGG